ncbi:MAG TPA: hypothetical protein VK604_07760 [Bryobacteraceae bacterium]|nr:hypothetical protein [Bryobacteraceae bacterium]
MVALPVVVKFDAAPTKSTTIATAKPAKPDSRAIQLRRFFGRLHCPVVDMAEDFIHAADDNHLDWRLLPSIAVIESGGGKAYKKNNIFGWNGGEETFPTIRAGLNVVAYKLGRSPLYRHHDSLGKLLLYNPEVEYADQVLAVMKRISPVDPQPAADKVSYRHSEYVYATN